MSNHKIIVQKSKYTRDGQERYEYTTLGRAFVAKNGGIRLQFTAAPIFKDGNEVWLNDPKKRDDAPDDGTE